MPLPSSADSPEPLGPDSSRASPPGSEPIDPFLLVPRRLGDFEIVREVGRGGMGVVFEAEDKTLGRRVALKVLSSALASRADQFQRFQFEAQVVARLTHPNILPVYSVGRDGGVAYFAMPLVAGTNLADLIHEIARPAPLEPAPALMPAPPRTGSDFAIALPSLVDMARHPAWSGQFYRAVADLGRQAALALAYSHEAGVWHRDIKPANLLLEPGGHLWVTDFGLARLEGDSATTSVGDVMGTFRYMSPEQIAGDRDRIDGRSDIYSLGMTLHEVLTRRPASAVGQGAAGWVSTRSSPPPLRRVDPRVPVDLETIVARATADHPDDRYASAAALAEDLRRFLGGEAILARRPTLASRFRRWSTRPERIPEAAQALFWIGVFLTVVNLASLVGFALGQIRPRDRGRFFSELGVGLVLFDLPTLACGVRAIRGRRDGLILGTVVVAHFFLLLLSSWTGLILFEYGGIVRDLGERWPLELMLILVTGFTMGRLVIGLQSARQNPSRD